VEGERRGRTIGFPTANLVPADADDRLVPGDGVYAGLAELQDGSAWPAAISIGRKPTFSGISRTIEAHLLDATGELYGQSMRLRFCRWLREQRPFPAVPALQQQLARDVQQTRQWHRDGRLASVGEPAFCA
jgi:riboflavin kinase/FMN adenylyltransferase